VQLPRAAEVLVVGAGIIGTAIAARLAKAGVDVCVVDRTGPAAGTTSAGEGNLLVSDKLPGPDLALAQRGLELWRELAEQSGERFEFEVKGGLVVAHDAPELEALWSLARSQRQLGVSVELVTADGLQELEPALSRDLAGGAFYEQDCQVQPMLAVAFHVAELGRHGGRMVPGVEVLGAEHDGDGAIRALRTTKGTVAVGRYVVNAAGPWSAELARRLGADIPVEPRRGHVLVTEPLPRLVTHKVYEAGYVGSVHESSSGWACSSVVESTKSGTMLLGSSREFVGFSHQLNPQIVATVAARAIALVPGLAGARLMRAYAGFRPATPDRLPVIGADPAVGSLLHATGHEGAGIGLSEVTAELVGSLVVGGEPTIDLAPFSASRFAAAAPRALASTTSEPSRPVARPNGTAAPTTRRARQEGPEGSAGTPPPRQVGQPDASPASGARLQFHFDGKDLTAPKGATIAGALLGSGERAWRTPRGGGQRRGLFCGIGNCFDCLVELNGESAVRSCLALVRDGDEVRSFGPFASGTAGAGSPASPGRRRPGGALATAEVVVVGAGPAGMAAAAAAAQRGAQVVLLDSSTRLGGQYFRQPLADGGAGGRPAAPAGPKLPTRFHKLVAGLPVDLWLGREVWSVSRDDQGFVVYLDDEEATALRSRALVLATGASELTLPFPGWELPGSVTAGAAQALLKSQGVAIGRRVVVAGTGPFLLPVAAALAKAGAQVTLVEAASARSAPRALAALLGHPAKSGEALGYALALARRRVRVLSGHAVVRCEGAESVERAVVARLGPHGRPVAGSEQAVQADAVCVSHGFVPRLELARQLGAHTVARAGCPQVSAASGATMGSSVPGLFVAGELTGVAGAEVAELEGELAGHAAASLLGLPDSRSGGERQRLERRLRKGRAFAAALERLYPLGSGWTCSLEPSTVFCRCEMVPWGAVEEAITGGATSAREVRNLTRCGMGYCQGRTCGPPLQLALSVLTGRPLDQVGDLHKRPVAVPVRLDRAAAWAGGPPG
jgi:glycine/D-amino acid oxidase-like deaminating enzyme